MGRVASPAIGDQAVHFPTRQYSPGWYCKNRNVRPWEGGKFSSRLPSLPGILEPHRFSPPDTMWASHSVSVAMVGDPSMKLKPCTPTGREFCSQDTPLASKVPHTWVRRPALSVPLLFLSVSMMLLL